MPQAVRTREENMHEAICAEEARRTTRYYPRVRARPRTDSKDDMLAFRSAKTRRECKLLRNICSPKYANNCVSRNNIPVLLPGASSQCHSWTGLWPLVVLWDGRGFSLDEFGTGHRFRPLIAPALQCICNATRRWPADGIRSRCK